MREAERHCHRRYFVRGRSKSGGYEAISGKRSARIVFLERIMSNYSNSESVGTFAEVRAPSWRVIASRIAAPMWTFWTQRQQRQELLDYIASDYRASADIGITSGEARGWSQRPFWRA
jgi:uncharacterized protein YjiS (DUF1127 family)